MPHPDPPPDCWLHPDLTSAPSDIAGTGLFSSTPLPEGTVIGRLGGRLVSTAELPGVIDVEDDYVDSVVVDEDVRLVLSPGSVLQLANHSCDPTTGWTDGYTLVLLADLAAGVELTHDYATSTADPEFLLRCHCDSYRCRQMIEGTDWRIPVLQRRYAGHWLPYLQRLIDAS